MRNLIVLLVASAVLLLPVARGTAQDAPVDGQEKAKPQKPPPPPPPPSHPPGPISPDPGGPPKESANVEAKAKSAEAEQEQDRRQIEEKRGRTLMLLRDRLHD